MKYKEEQRLACWDIKLVLLSLILMGLYRLWAVATGLHEGSQVAIVACLLLLISALYILQRTQLKVRVGKKGIKYHHSWWRAPRKISWSMIDEIRILRDSRAAQLSGWNVQFSKLGYHSLIGQTGLEIRLKDDSIIFIGIRNPDKLTMLYDTGKVIS